MSVSYTHLDVYKRQVKEWAEKRLPTVTLCSTTGNELLEVWYYGDLLTAVSYTHLDVYKRQGFPRRLQWIISMPSILWLGFTGGAGGWSKMIYGRFLYI